LRIQIGAHKRRRELQGRSENGFQGKFEFGDANTGRRSAGGADTEPFSHSLGHNLTFEMS
jgi:hypothetical protein